MARALLIALLLVSANPSSGFAQEPATVPASTRSLSVRVAESLKSLLTTWYPRAVDTAHGGFLSDFSYDWKPVGDQQKLIVSQARHVWTTARAAQLEFDLDTDTDYLGISYQGYRFLRDAMYDHVHGGFRSMVTREGESLTGPGVFIEGKTAYGNAFGIYALAAYFDASGDSTVLEFAVGAFRWLDDHAHDPVHGGYYQFFDDAGIPSRNGRGEHPAKDQNSSIHLLEAFTELYRVWPYPLLRDRLHEMLVIVRDTIASDEGYLRLFFEEDWTPISFRDSSRAFITEHVGLDHISFGHDVETAFLMMEAAELLGMEEEETLAKGKVMVDHALAYGWDDEYGGFFDGGYYFDSASVEVVIEEKWWWVQAEALNAFLLMAEHFSHDPHDYHGLFEQQWEYIDRYLIDQEHGGWYISGLDRNPESEEARKATIWKAAYHDGRALMNVLEQLQEGHE